MMRGLRSLPINRRTGNHTPSRRMDVPSVYTPQDGRDVHPTGRISLAARRSRASRSPHRRRGTLYVGVMMTATIVTLVGLSGLSVAHLGVRSAQNTRSTETASMLARAAVEEGVRQIRATATWRTTFANNTEYPNTPLALNGGTIAWRFIDSDGNLNNNSADGVRVYGIGRAGGAMYVESVLLQPTDAGVRCLEAPLHCAGDITLNSFCDLTTPQFISSNGAISASTTPSAIMGSAQAVGSITGNVTQSKTTGIVPRQMPGNTVFDYYLANGTWIDINSLPTSIGGRNIYKKVLSPSVNPFGPALNAEGIYVIDCQGQNLVIEYSRILGTLVIINPGSTCRVQGSVSWSPVSPNYPALLVRGNAQFTCSQMDLSENLLATNFNPTGAAYNGVVDTDTADVYPSKIKGLVYVSGQFRLPPNATATQFDGSVVCTTFQADSSGDGTFGYRPTHIHYPPPGFAAGNTMQVVPGTWQRSALP